MEQQDYHVLTVADEIRTTEILGAIKKAAYALGFNVVFTVQHNGIKASTATFRAVPNKALGESEIPFDEIVASIKSELAEGEEISIISKPTHPFFTGSAGMGKSASAVKLAVLASRRKGESMDGSPPGFTAVFSEELTPEQITGIIEALGDYFREIGGLGFDVSFEYEAVASGELVYA